ncbi:hypothetical protein E2C01_070332 [Portunus trituberculatus]|uniref:Uncharacterized protein n=1 Tax=Portunus trituberculatus TaxID=210409 RepID=A0A5B7HX08_PORTR|nr:hypothetical protein [Portunus trituberculatus]
MTSLRSQQEAALGTVSAHITGARLIFQRPLRASSSLTFRRYFWRGSATLAHLWLQRRSGQSELTFDGPKDSGAAGVWRRGRPRLIIPEALSGNIPSGEAAPRSAHCESGPGLPSPSRPPAPARQLIEPFGH